MGSGNRGKMCFILFPYLKSPVAELGEILAEAISKDFYEVFVNWKDDQYKPPSTTQKVSFQWKYFTIDGGGNIRDYGTHFASNNGGKGIAKSGGTTDIYATKIIPKGFTAISGSVYGSDTTNTLTWYSSSLTVATAAQISSDQIEAAAGTGSAYTNAVVGDGLTYVVAKWDPGSNDEVYGGKIYLKRT